MYEKEVCKTYLSFAVSFKLPIEFFPEYQQTINMILLRVVKRS